MRFGKTKRRSSDVAGDFDAPEVERALKGEWLTLALSHFETKFTTRHDRHDFDYPAAHGLVHFEYGTFKNIRSRLILDEEPYEPQRGKIGRAHFNHMYGIEDIESGYVIMEVFVDDPRGIIAKRLQDAFDSAAISQNRYVHISFRREKLDVDAMLTELRQQGYGADHPLTEVRLTRTTILSQAPPSSWTWSKRQ
jgi:hypothetical protein